MAENDRETLGEVIREELEHSEILKRLRAFEERSRPITMREVARHPLFLTVVGFLLTGAIGTWLESLYSDRIERQAELSDAIDLARAEELDAVKAFWVNEALTSRRLTAGSMLRSAIVRDSPDELPARKASYDAAYVDWNNEIKSRLIDLRRHVIAPKGDLFVDGSIFEPAIGDVILPLLTEIDGCLTEAYDAYRRTGGAATDFACPGQPDPACTGLVSPNVRRETKTRHEAGFDPGAGIQPEPPSNVRDACSNHWWTHVKEREAQARNCFDALSKDAFIYFRARTMHKIAVAKGDDSKEPKGRVPVFIEVCGDILGSDFEPWAGFVEKYGDQ